MSPSAWPNPYLIHAFLTDSVRETMNFTEATDKSTLFL